MGFIRNRQNLPKAFPTLTTEIPYDLFYNDQFSNAGSNLQFLGHAVLSLCVSFDLIPKGEEFLHLCSWEKLIFIFLIIELAQKKNESHLQKSI